MKLFANNLIHFVKCIVIIDAMNAIKTLIIFNSNVVSECIISIEINIYCLCNAIIFFPSISIFYFHHGITLPLSLCTSLRHYYYLKLSYTLQQKTTILLYYIVINIITISYTSFPSAPHHHFTASLHYNRTTLSLYHINALPLYHFTTLTL